MKYLLPFFLLIILGLFLASPALALAPLVPCGGEGQPLCTTCDFLVLGKNISDFVLIYLVPAISALLFIYAGFEILLGGGIPARVQHGRNVFQTTVYGLAIIFLAWLIVNTILHTVAGDENIAQNWWKLECRENVSTEVAGNANNELPPNVVDNNNNELPPNVNTEVNGSGNEELPPNVPNALTISGLKTDNVSENSAAIFWTTNRPATSQVQYTKAGDSQKEETVLETGKKSSHAIQLTGLVSNTNYTAKAISIDESQVATSEVNFKTKEKTTSPSAIIISSSAPVIRITAPPSTLTFTGTNLPANTTGTMIMTKKGASQPSQNFNTGSPASLKAFKFQADSGDEGTWTLKLKMPDGRESNTISFIVLPPVDTVSSENPSGITTALIVTTISLPDGKVSQDYSQALQATGGKTPYVWTKSAGNLPVGLSISSSGIISGRPMTAGTANFTVKVEDSSSPKRSVTKQFSIQVITNVVSNPSDNTGALVCKLSGTNLCQDANVSSTFCAFNTSSCSKFEGAVQKAASKVSIGGLNSSALIKSFILNESHCDINAYNAIIDPKTKEKKESCGPMQMQAATANTLKPQCGITANITCGWLRDPANLDGIVCLGAQYIKSIAGGTCGSSIRNIAAGYNGGVGACGASNDCKNDKSCSNETVKRWECLYDNPQHTVCNTGFDETRAYAPKVASCYNKNK